MGPGKVAAVHRVQMDAVKPLPEVVELAVAPGGDVAVILAVGHAEEVPFRLGVTNQENFGNHDKSFFSVSLLILYRTCQHLAREMIAA